MTYMDRSPRTIFQPSATVKRAWLNKIGQACVRARVCVCARACVLNSLANHLPVAPPVLALSLCVWQRTRARTTWKPVSATSR